jgi:glutamine synthetase
VAPHRATASSVRACPSFPAPRATLTLSPPTWRCPCCPAPRCAQFNGKDLLNGQTDGSSFPNGGLRATHTAGAFITVDPESAPFIMGDTMFLPAVVAAYSGVSLDEKTPLHRSVQALSKEGKRLLGLMGLKTAGLVNNIGLEQEIFLIPRDAYFRRPDLQFTGRTVMGRSPARGQEMSDHYMAPLSEASPALACMQAIQDKCFKVGIPLRTRHREVAPNQYEFAPLFGPVVSQTDQNLVVMQARGGACVHSRLAGCARAPQCMRGVV